MQAAPRPATGPSGGENIAPVRPQSQPTMNPRIESELDRMVSAERMAQRAHVAAEEQAAEQLRTMLLAFKAIDTVRICNYSGTALESWH